MDPLVQGIPRRYGAAIVLLAVVVTLCYAATSHIPGQLDKDWVHLWTAGRTVSSGHLDELYVPAVHHEILRATYPDGIPERIWPARNQRLGVFFYPPQAAFYYAAVGWLPRATAGMVNALVTLGLTLGIAALVARVSGALQATVLLALLLYPPFFFNYSLGQNAILTAAVIVVAWWLASRHRDLLAGIALGLLVCKPNWLVAVAWVPVIHGRWRMVCGVIVGASFMTVCVFALAGIGPLQAYVDLVPQVMALPQESGYTLQLKVSALGLFRKWLGAGTAADLWGYGSALIVGLVTWWVTYGLWGRDPRRLWTCSILASLWINPHLNNYDLVLVAAVLPVLWQSEFVARHWLMIIGFAAYLACPIDDRWPWWRTVPLPCLALLAVWCTAVVDAYRARYASAQADARVRPHAVCLEMTQVSTS